MTVHREHKVKRENQQDATNSMFIIKLSETNIELVASCWFSLFTLGFRQFEGQQLGRDLCTATCGPVRDSVTLLPQYP